MRSEGELLVGIYTSHNTSKPSHQVCLDTLYGSGRDIIFWYSNSIYIVSVYVSVSVCESAFVCVCVCVFILCLSFSVSPTLCSQSLSACTESEYNSGNL